MKCWYCGTTENVVKDPMTHKQIYLCMGHVKMLIETDKTH